MILSMTAIVLALINAAVLTRVLVWIQDANTSLRDIERRQAYLLQQRASWSRPVETSPKGTE